MQWTYSMCQLTEQDRNLIQLLLVILLFFKGISMAENESSLFDVSAVNRAQIRYTYLICNYLISKWDYERAVKHFIQILNHVFHLQTMTESFRSFLRDSNFPIGHIVEYVAPLMKTISSYFINRSINMFII